MTNSNIMVSVVIPAYNAGDTLRECVESVLAQSLREIEVIVIDDASTDRTLVVANELSAQDARLKVIHRSANGGASAARNLGLDAARGVWVAAVDSDDMIHPERLARMLQTGEMNDVDIVFDNLAVVTISGQREIYVPVTMPVFGRLKLETYIESHRRWCRIPCLGFLQPLVRRSVIEQNHIRYWPDIRVSEDTMFIVELMACGAKAFLLRDSLYEYKKRAGSVSAQFNTDDMRRFDTSFRLFLRDYQARLEAAPAQALTALVDENSAQLKARDILRGIVQEGRGSGLKELIRNKTARHFFVLETASWLKRLVLRTPRRLIQE